MDKLARAIDDVRRRWVPDRRLGVFDVAPDAGRLAGTTSSREAQDALRRLAADAGLAEAIRLLPDASAGDPAAIVTAAVAPLLIQPSIGAARATEALHGERLDILERQGEWLRVRGGDGYIAWTHAGYVATGPSDWSDDWQARAVARALRAEVQTEGGRRHLPTGARLAPRRDGTVELADGAGGAVVGGATRPEPELRAEARHLALPELALRRYGGAPYAWGGRTDWGIDCSGLVQAVYAARGVAVPRDSDQQYGAGRAVALAPSGAGYDAGDLLFFADEGRVSHVALWAGAGRIVHAALSRGGVGTDNLFGDEPRMERLREALVGVRRMVG